MLPNEKYSSSVSLTVVTSLQNGHGDLTRHSQQSLLLDPHRGVRIHQVNAKVAKWQTQSNTQKISDCEAVPCVTNVAKVREGIRLASTRLRLEFRERREPFKPLSEKGLFSHYYLEPLWDWWGKNDRVLLTPSLSNVDIKERDGDPRSVISGASHNYAGFYRATAESEELQRLCLDKLPIADSRAVPSLEAALHNAVARFFDAEFCHTTGTGYGSNLLALPAILNGDWLVILDEKSHNSMYAGSFLALAGCIRRFGHNNMSHLEAILQEQAGNFENVLVAIEGFYSMDGTVPALDRLHKLKQLYHFSVYCDEAHSFLSIGKTGRGCLELWNDENPMAQLPWDLIDIRTATLSKAVGCVGGLVCGNHKFKGFVRKRVKVLSDRGDEPLTTSTMVQTLYILGQPARLTRHLHRLRAISQFCRRELKRYGIHVYGDASTPVLPVHTGRPSWAAKMSHVLRGLGLMATPVSTPAVDFWESRVRICLSADHDDGQVNQLLDCVIEAAQSIGVIQKVDLTRMLFEYENFDSIDRGEEDIESRTSFTGIKGLVLRDAAHLQGRTRPSQLIFDKNCGTALLEVGHVARKRYGIGSGGSRWVCGTFLPHLEVENLITQIMQTEAAMTFPSADIGLSTTIAALCRELIGYPEHYLIIPKTAPASVFEGIRMAPKNGGPTLVEYANVAELFFLLTGLYERKIYITLYLDTFTNGVAADLEDLIIRLTRCKGPRWGMSVLLNDFNGLGHNGQNQLGVATTLNMQKVAKMLDIQILICGSFYRAFGLVGGYLTGSKVLIQELRYTVRGYMYTSSPQPFVMEMIKTALEKMLRAEQSLLLKHE